jgi:DNA (cytosine-5)-methyltransferase 1
MKILELFSGYGTASFALKRLGIEYELVGYSDIDKYANQCFKQNHCPDDVEDMLRLGDITKVDEKSLPDFDILTGGFPCQAFSVAGKMQGELDSRGTLFYEIIRIAEVKQPKFMLLENVKGLTTKKFKDTFAKILSELGRIGYNVYWEVLNSKDYGIPQSRARVWFVCIRKDIDSRYFQFPQEFPLSLKLKDILEEQVDAKYYLKPEQVERLLANVKEKGVWNSNPSAKGMNGNVNTNEVSTTLSTNKGEGSKITIPCLTPDRIEKRQNGRRFKEDGEPSFTLNAQDKHGILQVNNPKHSQQRVYDPEGISPTIAAGNLGGGKSPSKIVQINNPTHSNDRVYSSEGSAPSLNTMQGGNRQPFITHPTITQALGRSGSSSEYMKSVEAVSSNTLTIRKLTPTECFRLQGFLKDQINLDGLSDSQKYKLAGNGQDVNVVTLIFKQMFNEKK